MRATFLAATILLAVGSARACTEIVLNDTCTPGGAVVSSRTLSFPAAFHPEVSSVKAGTSVALLEVGGDAANPVWSTYGQAVEAKYSFVCASIARNELRGYYGENSTRGRDNWLWCTDGLNSAGLSCAIQYQGLTKKINPYDPNDAAKPDAIDVDDLCTFALARWASVPEAKEALAKTQLAWPAELYKAWGRAMSQGKSDAVPWHFSITDDTGRGIIVQIRDGVVEVLDNRDGVFTNEPFLQEHWKYMDEWDAKMKANPKDVYPSIHAEPVPELVNDGPSVFAAGSDGADGPMFLPLPGDYSGPSRYTRLAMVKKYGTDKICWTNDSVIAKGEKEELNPAYILPGQPASNQALLAALGVTNTVYLPRGVSDHGTTKTIEWTPLATLRDHGARAYYIRAANSPVFYRLDVEKLAAKNAGGMITKPLVTPGTHWFVDVGTDTA